MSGLLLPVGPRRMSSWTAHQQRSPKSAEPGTDFYCPIGTPVLAPAAGVIYGHGTSILGATGRWVGVDLDNGQRFRSMHHSRLVRTLGRVKRGEVIALSGASGYGEEDWSADPNTGGAHTHVTLWPTHNTRYGYDANGKPYTLDFMLYADTGSTAGGGSTPFPGSPQEDDDMPTYLIEHTGADAQGGWYLANGQWKRLSPSGLTYFTSTKLSDAWVHVKTDGNLAALQEWHAAFAPVGVDINGVPTITASGVDVAALAKAVADVLAGRLKD